MYGFPCTRLKATTSRLSTLYRGPTCASPLPSSTSWRLIPCWASHTLTASPSATRSEEHTSELQSPCNLVCRLLLEKKKKKTHTANGRIQPLPPYQLTTSRTVYSAATGYPTRSQIRARARESERC